MVCDKSQLERRQPRCRRRRRRFFRPNNVPTCSERRTGPNFTCSMAISGMAVGASEGIPGLNKSGIVQKILKFVANNGGLSFGNAPSATAGICFPKQLAILRLLGRLRHNVRQRKRRTVGERALYSVFRFADRLLVLEIHLRSHGKRPDRSGCRIPLQGRCGHLEFWSRSVRLGGHSCLRNVWKDHLIGD
jgi:hypothetical protein